MWRLPLKAMIFSNSSTKYSWGTMYSVWRILDFGPAFVEQNMHERGHVEIGRTWIMFVPLSISPNAIQPTNGIEFETSNNFFSIMAISSERFILNF
jgi:hypothetical protein